MMYQFTSNQLTKILQDAIASYVEYVDQHGKDDETARLCAIGEVLDGLHYESELREHGEHLTQRFTPIRSES